MEDFKMAIIGVILIIVTVVVIIASWYVGTMNKLNRTKLTIDQAKADIEVYMVKRYDVIMNSLELCKKFMQHEEEIFTKMIRLRQGASVNELTQQASIQNEAMQKLLAVGEAYPELSELFTTLQQQLSDENAHYAASKRVYNNNVTRYNQIIVTFPDSIIANSLGMHKEELFKDETAESKKVADIKF